MDRSWLRVASVVIASFSVACSSSSTTSPADAGTDATPDADATLDAPIDGDGASDVPVDAADADAGDTLDADASDALDGDVSDGSETGSIDPATCAEAALAKSSVGCEFWPTVVGNIAWSIFDFAVVVANPNPLPADVTISGPGGTTRTVTVAGASIEKIYLPWQADLKGGDTDNCGTAVAMTASVRATGGAFHLVSTRPVSAYQFSTIEYKGAGGPSGKSWASCPGSSVCTSYGAAIGCYSFSTDASLLLPSTALTGSYRIPGVQGWTGTDPLSGAKTAIMGAYFAITATRDGTDVTVTVGPKGKVLAGSGIAATASGGTISLTGLKAGDVVEVVSEAGDYDLSGSSVVATQPVQVISGSPCIQAPIGTNACDHVEETVLPLESWGKDYLVPTPSGPRSNLPGHVVRLHGLSAGTTLTYSPTAPAGAPTTIGAGEVVDLGVVKSDFRVTGSSPFAVATFLVGGSLADPTGGSANLGDPSMSLAIPTTSFRRHFVFAAPDDFDVAFADVVAPMGTTLTLDAVAVTKAATPIGSTGFGVVRLPLGKVSAHELSASAPVGVQVIGYAPYASYQYPAGVSF